MDLTMMERVGDRWETREGYCSTGQSPQRAVVPVEEEEAEEEDEEEEEERVTMLRCTYIACLFLYCSVC
jgi:hypothetical protein